jgi:hypothetical protein
MAPSDVHYAGADAWAQMTGMSPLNPLVGGSGMAVANMPYNVDGARSRIVSTDAPRVDPMDPTGPGVALLDDWRDVLNFRGSPVPWLLLLSLAILGFMQLRVSARVGKHGAHAAIG